jgi:WD40 repeat protein
VQVWDAATGKTAFVFLRHGAAIQQARWSPNGTYVAVCSLGARVVHVWNADTKRLVYTYRGQPHGVQAIGWSPDSKYIASAGPDWTVQVWNATTGAHAFSFRDPAATAGATPTVPGHARNGGGNAAAGEDGTAAARASLQEPPAGALQRDGSWSGTKTVNWSRDGNYCCSGGSNGSVTVTASGSRW